jgi:hypothetical protein
MPEEFTQTWPQLACQEIERQYFNDGFTVEYCQEKLQNLGANMAVFAITGATPWPGDEIIAGTKLVGTIKNSSGIITAFLVLTTANLVVDGLVKIQVDALPHSNPNGVNHDPYTAGSKAEKIVLTTIAAFAANGNVPDDNQLRCLALYIGDSVSRYIYWKQAYVSKKGIPYGDLSWTHANGVYGGAYPNKNLHTLTNVPGDIAAQFGSATIKPLDPQNCPPPPLLMAQ